jgi:hypothetical protein
MSRFVCRFTVLTAVTMSCLSAWAAPINLNPNLALSVNPGSTGLWTLSATNQDNGAAANGWKAFAVAMQIIPDPGATGTVTLQSFINPVDNPSIPAGSAGPASVSSGVFPQPINGTTSFTSIILGYNDANFTSWPSGQTHNMATITWSASPDASGSWRVYASNPEDNFIDLPQTTWNLPNANDVYFGNVPFVSGTTSTLQLGTISAVPEPSSLMLAASAIVAASWYGWRSRRNPLVVEA